MKTNMEEFMNSGEYLPKPLRDFHDAKDVFKAMHKLIAVDKNQYAKEVSWPTGQCYVIDVFLWFMAKRGWTLQRSRAKIDFYDLGADILSCKHSESKALTDYINSRKEAKNEQ